MLELFGIRRAASLTSVLPAELSAAKISKAKTIVEVVDKPFANAFGVSYQELVPWLPTFPVHIRAVHNAWPAALQRRLSQDKLLSLALRHYMVCQVVWTGQGAALMVQPHLYDVEGFGTFDKVFLDGALLELTWLQRIVRIVGREFTPLEEVSKLADVNKRALLNCSDVFEFSDDLSTMRLHPELGILRCFDDVKLLSGNVNTVLRVIAGLLPTRFVHIEDITFPAEFDRRWLFHCSVAHAVECMFPFVRLREDFDHSLKGTASIGGDARVCEALPAPQELICDHNAFFFPGALPPSEVTIIEHPGPGTTSRYLTAIREGDAIGVHILRSQPHLPAMFIVCLPKAMVALVLSIDEARNDHELQRVLSDKLVTKLLCGFTARRSEYLFQHHQLCVRGWANIRDLALFSGYPIGIGRRLSWKMLIRDVGGVSLDALRDLDNSPSLNWTSIALTKQHCNHVRCFFALYFGAANLWSRGGRSVLALLDGKLSNTQLVSVNAMVRLWSLEGLRPVAATIPSPCSNRFAANAVKQLKAALRHTSIEGVSLPKATTPLTDVVDVFTPQLSATAVQGSDGDIADALAASAFFDHAAAKVDTSCQPQLSIHDMIAQRLSSIAKQAAAPTTISTGGLTKAAAREASPRPDETVPVVPTNDIASALADICFDDSTTTAPARTARPHEVHALPSVPPNVPAPPTIPPTSMDVSRLADVVLPVEYMSPSIDSVPPPARYPMVQIPPSTRGFFAKKAKKNPAVPPAQPLAPNGVSLAVGDLPEEVRRKIAEDWLKEQIKNQSN